MTGSRRRNHILGKGWSVDLCTFREHGMELALSRKLVRCDSHCGRNHEKVKNNRHITISSKTTENTLMRLVFHDCMRYQDGTGGCDGCINFKVPFDETWKISAKLSPLILLLWHLWFFSSLCQLFVSRVLVMRARVLTTKTTTTRQSLSMRRITMEWTRSTPWWWPSWWWSSWWW